MRFIVVISLIAVTGCGGISPETPLEVTFIANAGFLISTPSHAVLIDAVFGTTEEPELGWAPRPKVLAAIEAAATPFDRIDAVLASHDHLDHFEAYSLARFLASAPEAVLVCPGALAEAMKEEAPAVAWRIRGLSAAWGSSAQTGVGDLSITGLAVPHAGEDWLDYGHLAYLVEMDGRKLLHLGDASEAAKAYEPFAWLADEEIDVAFVAPWQLRNPEMIDVLRRVIRPEQIVLMHIRESAREEIIGEIATVQDELPPIHLFRDKMTSERIPIETGG